jgi:hypothetical protein
MFVRLLERKNHDENHDEMSGLHGARHRLYQIYEKPPKPSGARLLMLDNKEELPPPHPLAHELISEELTSRDEDDEVLLPTPASSRAL